MMRIKTWHFSIRQHRELIPRSILAMHVSGCRGRGDPQGYRWYLLLSVCVPVHYFNQSSLLMFQAQDPQMLDQLSKNITRCGLSNSTLNYLRVSEARTQPVYPKSDDIVLIFKSVSSRILAIMLWYLTGIQMIDLQMSQLILMINRMSDSIFFPFFETLKLLYSEFYTFMTTSS